jgi:hypothetical protein
MSSGMPPAARAGPKRAAFGGGSVFQGVGAKASTSRTSSPVVDTRTS